MFVRLSGLWMGALTRGKAEQQLVSGLTTPTASLDLPTSVLRKHPHDEVEVSLWVK